MSVPLSVFDIQFSGHHLVEAAAGTGKTFNITSLYVRALIEKELKPSQLLVLTFTNDATTELKLRLRSRIQEIIDAKEKGDSADDFVNKLLPIVDKNKLKHLKECLFQFDEAAISTIHGFCQKILSEHHLDFNVSPTFNLEPNLNSLILESVDEFWDNFFFQSDPANSFQRWYRNQLNLEFKSPDNLLKQINHFLLNTDIALEPSRSTIDNFQPEYEIAKKLFKQLRAAYESEKADFDKFFYSDALNKNSYRSKDQLQSTFEDWLIKEGECPKNYKKLYLFGAESIINNTKKDFEPSHFTFSALIDEYIETYERIAHINVVFKTLSINQIREIISSNKKRRQILGYQDLLVSVRDGLTTTGSLGSKLASRFPIAFIDEFQDTDHIQYSIFKSIYANQEKSCLIMIGDPKQAIYRFRGADLNTYLAAKELTPLENIYTLKDNYRSSSKMISAVNSFFGGTENPFLIEGLYFENAQFPSNRADIAVDTLTNDIPPCNLIKVDTNDKRIEEVRLEIAKSVSSEIINLLKGDIKLNQIYINQKDIAVLVDTHHNAEIIQEVLWEYGLRSTIRSKSSVYLTKESDELYTILHAILSPTNNGYIKSALLTNFLGYNANWLINIENNESDWLRIQTDFIELNIQWIDGGLSRVFNLLESTFKVFENLATRDNPERSITNYKHLKELLLDAEQNNSLTPNGLIRYYRSKRKGESVDASDDEIIRLESDDDLIQIVTHHSSKGLEYPVVFCPYLWNFSIKSSKTPVSSNGLSQIGFLDEKSVKFQEALLKNREEETAEKIRLAYVALTRAKAMCYIYHSGDSKTKKDRVNAIQHLINENKLLEKYIRDQKIIQEKELVISDEKFQSEIEHKTNRIKTVQFKRTDLSNFQKWYSFSSLTHQSKDDFTDDTWGFDFDEDTREDLNSATQNIDRFSLPKGKDTGNLLHTIFEEIDFTDQERHLAIVEEQLTNHGFDKHWTNTVVDLVQDSITHLLVNDISLNQITESDKLVEMEFNFPLNKMSPKQLFEIVGLKSKGSSFNLSGFMKGFIDLIFRKDGQYFLLDYKSNHLGNSFESYSGEIISKEMKDANYILQYHIYLIAFLRFIRLKKPDFDYETEFGGVLYLFLRGVNPAVPGSGVYFHKPELETIEKLDLIMNGIEIE